MVAQTSQETPKKTSSNLVEFLFALTRPTRSNFTLRFTEGLRNHEPGYIPYRTCRVPGSSTILLSGPDESTWISMAEFHHQVLRAW